MPTSTAAHAVPSSRRSRRVKAASSRREPCSSAQWPSSNDVIPKKCLCPTIGADPRSARGGWGSGGAAPLRSAGSPTTIFTSPGRQPLQLYSLGFSQPPAPRLASCQKCLRTGDIEEVGKTDRHNTFFEMMGNFTPTGAYFKETAIPLAWELVTDGFKMPAERLRVTIHPTDDEAFKIWTESTGVPAAHVTRLADNWWGLGLGPCGPDSQIWRGRGADVGCGRPDCVPDHCERFTEFWNLVFPQFDQQADGTLVPLKNPAIDTGMGL